MLLLCVEAELEHLRISYDGVQRRSYVMADGGEEILLRLCGFVLALRHRGVYGEHDGQREHDERHLDEVVQRERIVNDDAFARKDLFILFLRMR